MASSPLLIRKLFFVNHTSDIAVFAGPRKTFPTVSSEKATIYDTETRFSPKKTSLTDKDPVINSDDRETSAHRHQIEIRSASKAALRPIRVFLLVIHPRKEHCLMQRRIN